MLVAVSHEAVAPAHALVLVAVHWAQVPLARQAGVVLVGQGAVAPEPLSPLHVEAQLPQPPHWPLVQIGALSAHAALAPLPLSPLHCTHAPLTQTGKAPLHCAALEQGKQAALAPGGLGHLPPPLTVDPRHVQGLTLVSAPQASPTLSVVQTPATSPGTVP